MCPIYVCSCLMKSLVLSRPRQPHVSGERPEHSHTCHEAEAAGSRGQTGAVCPGAQETLH